MKTEERKSYEEGVRWGCLATLKEVYEDLDCVSHVNDTINRRNCAICKYRKQLEAKIKELEK